MTALEYLESLRACQPALDWVRSRPVERQTLARLWEDCPRGDWMLWLAGRQRDADMGGIVAAAWACVHLAEGYAAAYAADAAYAAYASAKGFV